MVTTDVNHLYELEVEDAITESSVNLEESTEEIIEDSNDDEFLPEARSSDDDDESERSVTIIPEVLHNVDVGDVEETTMENLESLEIDNTVTVESLSEEETIPSTQDQMEFTVLPRTSMNIEDSSEMTTTVQIEADTTTEPPGTVSSSQRDGRVDSTTSFGQYETTTLDGQDKITTLASGGGDETSILAGEDETTTSYSTVVGKNGALTLVDGAETTTPSSDVQQDYVDDQDEQGELPPAMLEEETPIKSSTTESMTTIMESKPSTNAVQTMESVVITASTITASVDSTEESLEITTIGVVDGSDVEQLEETTLNDYLDADNQEATTVVDGLETDVLFEDLEVGGTTVEDNTNDDGEMTENYLSLEATKDDITEQETTTVPEPADFTTDPVSFSSVESSLDAPETTTLVVTTLETSTEVLRSNVTSILLLGKMFNKPSTALDPGSVYVLSKEIVLNFTDITLEKLKLNTDLMVQNFIDSGSFVNDVTREALVESVNNGSSRVELFRSMMNVMNMWQVTQYSQLDANVNSNRLARRLLIREFREECKRIFVEVSALLPLASTEQLIQLLNLHLRQKKTIIFTRIMDQSSMVFNEFFQETKDDFSRNVLNSVKLNSRVRKMMEVFKQELDEYLRLIVDMMNIDIVNGLGKSLREFLGQLQLPVTIINSTIIFTITDPYEDLDGLHMLLNGQQYDSDLTVKMETKIQQGLVKVQEDKPTSPWNQFINGLRKKDERLGDLSTEDDQQDDETEDSSDGVSVGVNILGEDDNQGKNDSQSFQELLAMRGPLSPDRRTKGTDSNRGFGAASDEDNDNSDVIIFGDTVNSSSGPNHSETVSILSSPPAVVTSSISYSSCGQCQGAEEPCVTVGGRRPGLPCVFPFSWNGVMIEKCIKHGRDKFWCPTQLTNESEIIDSEWGYCGDHCISPVHYMDDISREINSLRDLILRFNSRDVSYCSTLEDSIRNTTQGKPGLFNDEDGISVTPADVNSTSFQPREFTRPYFPSTSAGASRDPISPSTPPAPIDPRPGSTSLEFIKKWLIKLATFPLRILPTKSDDDGYDFSTSSTPTLGEDSYQPPGGRPIDDPLKALLEKWVSKIVGLPLKIFFVKEDVKNDDPSETITTVDTETPAALSRSTSTSGSTLAGRDENTEVTTPEVQQDFLVDQEEPGELPPASLEDDETTTESSLGEDDATETDDETPDSSSISPREFTKTSSSTSSSKQTSSSSTSPVNESLGASSESVSSASTTISDQTTVSTITDEAVQSADTSRFSSSTTIPSEEENATKTSTISTATVTSSNDGGTSTTSRAPSAASSSTVETTRSSSTAAPDTNRYHRDGFTCLNSSSCVGKCGGESAGCFCDKSCVYTNDCCCDFLDICLMAHNIDQLVDDETTTSSTSPTSTTLASTTATASTTRPSTRPGRCKTRGGPATKHGCVFPFKYNKSWFYGCTTVDTRVRGKPWCSTRVDSRKNFIPGNIKYLFTNHSFTLIR